MMETKQPQYHLVSTRLGLQLQSKETPSLCLHVDFLQMLADFRRGIYYSNKSLLEQAMGLSKKKSPLQVVDATAGLGQDGFLLSLLGCNVLLVERSEYLFALLADAEQRANASSEFHSLKLRLLRQDAHSYLESLIEEALHPDVIYLDPMYPERKKAALNKVEMRVLKDIVGDDEDAGELLTLALAKAKKRVVVKRPKLAPCLGERTPDLVFKGKSTRFDVYLPSYKPSTS